MAFVDHTQQYRHGVLIGNWNEEEFGLERAANPAAGATGLPSQERFKSVQKASYVRPDTEALYAAADARVSAPDCRKGVGAGLITQDGVQGSQYFQSSYAKSWGQGQAGTIKPDYTLSKVTVRFTKHITRTRILFSSCLFFVLSQFVDFIMLFLF